jgi:hypothetical protein
MLDDIESFDDPFVYQDRIHSSPAPKPLPLKDLITGQPLERLTRLVGAFARAGLSGSVDPRDALWLGNELGGLREFLILKADHRWVNQILEALGRALGPHRRTWDPEALGLAVRLRRMQDENWPPVPGAWVELLTLVEAIENPRVEAGSVKPEPKDSSLAGKAKGKPGRPRREPNLNEVDRLVQQYGSEVYGRPASWWAKELGIPPSTIKDSWLWEKIMRIREADTKGRYTQTVARNGKDTEDPAS